jgi:predicted Ser/Thr protein kinase
LDAKSYLKSVGEEVKSIFVQNRMILSFDEWTALFLQEPRRHARSAAQYLRDALDYFGTYEIDVPVGATRRFRLFDREFDQGAGRVAGQEDAQNAIYRILGNFVRAGKVNKLILLHGPNGSSKSSLVSALVRGLEVYSRAPEGAMYKINWVFPTEKLVKGSIGFSERMAGAVGEPASYARLEAEEVDAHVSCEMKDHPLFLVPHKERRRLLEELCGGDDFVLAEPILEGELCHKCRQIYAGLLAAHGGDFLEVMKHVQVERFYVSQRYLSSAVTVEPQLSVDASYHQVTADRSLGHLPPSLQNLDLFEPYGPLVYGNRGIVEFSDLLKRQVESFKYLLGTTETNTVPLEHFLLHVDEVWIGTSNEKHLGAFKDIPDFASFKGRIELVRVPYVRRIGVEQEIYDAQITRAAIGKHLAPHATRAAAAWAVLTRLKRPDPDRYDRELRDVLEDLSPLEKARLYDAGLAPDRLTVATARELKKALGKLYGEWESTPLYEGRSGASAREVKTVLFNAAQHPQYACLTPQAVLGELAELCKDKSVYDFLQQEIRDGYHDHEEFVRIVEAEVLDLIDDEVRDSMGLVTERQYEDLFGRYVRQVSHWVKGEKIANRITGQYEQPDEEQMLALERLVRPEGQERGDFRRGLIASVGAWRLDHPTEKAVEYARIFPDLFRRIRDHYFDERKATLRRNKENVLKFLSPDERGTLSPKEARAVEELLERMTTRYGYCEACARDAILFLMQRRYTE